MTRRKHYKGLEVTLQGPHFNNPDGQPYLPGSEHRSALHVASAYGEGIHFTSHRRVAARWAPVVAEVTVLGATFLIPEKVAPRYRKDIPAWLAMGKYNKYRTDHLRVERIVGVATYGPMRQGSYNGAVERVVDLNQTLKRHDLPRVQLTGEVLERLRDDGFNLWEVEAVPQPTTTPWLLTTWTVTAPMRAGAEASSEAVGDDIRDFVAARLGVTTDSVEVT